MGKDSSVSVKLGIDYNEEILRDLLEKAEGLGFRFYKSFLTNDKPILLESAYELLISRQEAYKKESLEGDKIPVTFPFIVVSVEDTYPNLWIHSNDDCSARVALQVFGSVWKKDFIKGDPFVGDVFIDVNRYAKILLNLVEDYPIVSLDAYVD